MRRASRADYVASEYVFVVLLADVLVRLPPGVPFDIPAHSPGFGVCAGIVDGSLVVESVFIRARVAFDDVQLFGVRMPCRVEPGSIVEARDVNDQSICLLYTSP